MKRLVLLLFSCFYFVLPGQAFIIFDRGAEWRWRPGTNEASAPIEAWRARDFVDSQFTTAPSPFWYGDVYPGGTQITGMQNNYLCLFLRKTFVITNVAEIGALKLGALVDDGFVAWINGIEVRRVNMNEPPGSAVTISTLGANAVEPVSFTTYNDLPAPSTYLVEGTNVITVQVVQSSLGSSDIGFDASLEAIVNETIPPTVASVVPTAGSTITNLTQVTVNFSEPVSGVDAFDLMLNNSAASALSSNSSSSYVFTFTQPAYGTVQISWNPSHGIVDRAAVPNAFNATGPGATWQYNLVDTTPPLIASLSPPANTTVRSLNAITVLFSEAVFGVDAADLLINGAPAGGITTVAANQYIFTFSEPPTGTVQVAWSNTHGITDRATSPNAFGGGSWTYQLNPNAPEAMPYISEFMASNSRTLADENGEFSDWIEIFNPSSLTLNLDGWFLTDSSDNLTQWRFPATNLPSGGFLVVFASGKDRRVPGAPLHTDFKLSAGGEYLALVAPDGSTIATEFRPAFPPQVSDVSYGFAQFGDAPLFTAGTNGVYFTAPTPGAANLGGVTTPGPVIADVHHTPNIPLEDDNLIVTARIQPSFFTVAGVTMRYRVMFDPEVTVTMVDDGAHGDGLANDGIFGAIIPASASTNSQMVRYYVSSTDVNGHASRWPLFPTAVGSAQYLGTVVNPNYVTSSLPIVHFFAPPNILQPPAGSTSQIGADSQGGSAGVSLYFNGEFYDNIYMSLRGNTTAGYSKKSHRLEFNREHLFRHDGPGPRLHKTSFEADFPDPTYMRQGMSFWLCDQLGAPSTFYIPYRLQLNGQFYQFAHHNDIHGEELLSRLGYDPNGALYNAAGTVTPDRFSTGGFEKKTRRWDSDNDYAQLAAAVSDSVNNGTRRTNIFDMLDLPEVINYLVAARFVQENDDVWANMSLYHDNDGDDLWRIVPFDMNLSWGAFYLDNGLNDSGIQATNDNHKSFPLYGSGVALSLTSGNFNRIYDVIFQVPQAREMFLRRMRTMLDTLVLPIGTPAGASPIEQRLLAWRDQIAADAAIDRLMWGYAPLGGQNNLPGTDIYTGVNDLLNQFYYLRRNHLYGKHSVTNTALPIGITKDRNAGIPITQPANAYLTIVDLDFNPSGGNQQQEYVCLTNPAPFAIDISGWKLDGAVQFTFAPGTVVPANSLIYVSPNVRAFRARTSGPRGGQALFVVGPSKGQLSARGESLQLVNGFGQTLTTFTYPGAPSVAQQFLRITEIMYHPAATTNAEDFEYIELQNLSPSITVSLVGVRLTNGIDFSFSGSSVTSLAPGGRVLVVKNIAAFTSRYGSGLPIAGQYIGSLDNSGERLQLVDSNNEEILDFSYNNSWYPVTDGLGFSLVITDPNAQADAWDSKAQWRASGTLNGTPGGQDPGPAVIAPILVNEVLSRTDVPPPTDSIEVFNPTGSAVNIGGWWLSDDFNTPKKYQIPNPTTINPNSFVVFTEANFNPGGAGFALGSDGDEVWLFSADGAGNLTGYVDGYDFGAAEDGVSFGRYVTSTGEPHLVAQVSRTLGAANAGPRVGPVVINEIMYHPASTGDGDNTDDEYIELLNSSGTAVGLFDPANPTNTWKISGGVDFTFPGNIFLASGEFALVVNFSPTNAAALASFRSRFGVSNSVQIFGPYGGHLGNASDNVELKKPTTPLPGKVPYVLVDKVSYTDSAPWPEAADSFGLSLQRINPVSYGNDPINWKAIRPTAGRASSIDGTAPAITAQPQDQSLFAFADRSLSVSASGSNPLSYQWSFNGINIPEGTNSLLVLRNIQPQQGGAYRVAIFNSAGSVVSSNALVTVELPAAILQQPQPVTTRPGVATNLSVVAFSATALRYQWQKDGVNLPNATNSSLVFANVQPGDSANYTVVVTDGHGSVSSAPAPLTVLVDPTIVQSPVSVAVVPGSTVVMSVTVTNGTTMPVGYRWQSNGVFFAGGFFTLNSRTAFYTFTNARPPFNSVRVVATNSSRPGGLISAAATITYLTDSDGDGIPDAWEAAYGFNTNNVADAVLDSDGDGMSNRAEYIAGTNPTNALSYLKVERVTGAPSATTVEFLAVSNRTYSVLYKNSLPEATWQPLVDVAARTTNHLETLRDPTATTNRFYRLVTPKQP